MERVVVGAREWLAQTYLSSYARELSVVRHVDGHAEVVERRARCSHTPARIRRAWNRGLACDSAITVGDRQGMPEQCLRLEDGDLHLCAEVDRVRPHVAGLTVHQGRIAGHLDPRVVCQVPERTETEPASRRRENATSAGRAQGI